MSLSERFTEKMQVREDGCWEWLAARDRDGYGLFTAPKARRQQMAHRYAYEQVRGVIPEGLQIDHLCRFRSCVNPDHLEAVTCRENLMRGETAAARNSRKTHCSNGHEFTQENTRRDRLGNRQCWVCTRRVWRDYYHRHRAKAITAKELTA